MQLDEEDILSQLEDAAADEELAYEPRPEDAQTIGEAADQLEMLKGLKRNAEAEASKLGAEIKRLEQFTVPDLMRKAGIVKGNKGTFTTPTGGRISLRTDTVVGVKAADRDRLHQWLRDQGDGDLVKETVHPGTLKSHIKAVMAAGTKLPEFISTFIEVRAVLTRGK